MSNTLIIRTDANIKIGTGHFMRCLAIAQNYRSLRKKACFVMADTSLEIIQRINKENLFLDSISIEPGSSDDAIMTAEIALRKNATWIVIDGYQFNSKYQKIIKDAGLKILFIDDYGHSDHYFADIVLNQNIYADENIYKNREPYTKLLLGTSYVLLKEEFILWKSKIHKRFDSNNNILVTLGGSDPENQTLKVLNAINSIDYCKLSLIVVLGCINPHMKALQFAISNTHHHITLHKNIANMPELMAWADFAISGGGTTCYELLYMVLPNIILILADNQELVSKSLVERGVSLSLGYAKNINEVQIAKCVEKLLKDPHLVHEMSLRATSLIDGKGANRIIDAIKLKSNG